MKKSFVKKIFLVAVALCAVCQIGGCTRVTLVDEKPVEVVVTGDTRCFILDTDWLSDVDDAVAVRYLVRKHLAGEIALMGINIDAMIKTSAPALDSFVANEGVRLPISVDYEGSGLGISSLYHGVCLTKGGGSVHETSLEYPDSVAFYRQKLASLPEGVKCDIISIGFMNSLARLLDSPPDALSPLSGSELIREKVGKLWAMAGEFPKGREYNIRHKPLSIQSAISISERWVTPVVFLGFECGKDVKTGGTIARESGKNDLLYRCLRKQFAKNGRSSWDPMTAYLAVIGSPENAGFSTVEGRIVIQSDGSNTFEKADGGKHCYVVKEKADDFYRNEIDKIVAAPR